MCSASAQLCNARRCGELFLRHPAASRTSRQFLLQPGFQRCTVLQKEMGSLSAKLETVATERDQLKSAKSEIMHEAEYQQRAMAQLTQQLHQLEARLQQGEASKETPKSSLEVAALDEDDVSGALLLSTMVTVLSLTATILYAKALRSVRRQLREASHLKSLVSRCSLLSVHQSPSHAAQTLAPLVQSRLAAGSAVRGGGCSGEDLPAEHAS